MEFVRFALLLLAIFSVELEARSLAEENLERIISDALEALEEIELARQQVDDDVMGTGGETTKTIVRGIVDEQNERELEQKMADMLDEEFKASELVDLQKKNGMQAVEESEKSLEVEDKIEAGAEDTVSDDEKKDKDAGSREETANVLVENNLDNLIDIIARSIHYDSNVKSKSLDAHAQELSSTKKETDEKDTAKKEIAEKNISVKDKSVKKEIDTITAEEDKDVKESEEKKSCGEHGGCGEKEKMEAKDHLIKTQKKETTATQQNDDDDKEIRQLLNKIFASHGKTERKRDSLAKVVEGILERFSKDEKD